MLHDRTYELLYNSVSQAFTSVESDDPDFDAAALTKRVVRQFSKAASDEALLSLPWNEACKQYVERAMQGYASSSGSSEWFFRIDLVPALAGAAMEIVNATGQAANPSGVWEICQMEYEDKLDRAMFDKALWEVTGALFPDDKLRGKVFHALSKSYWPNLDTALNDGNLHRDVLYGLDPATDLRRVEAFTKAWINDGISRSWAAIEQSSVELTEALVQELIRQLIAPFGEEHPYSCLPVALTERLGRPPMDWAFIKPAVSELFRSWNGEGEPSQSRKRRRKGGGGGGEWPQDGEEGYLEPQAKAAAAPAKKKKWSSVDEANAEAEAEALGEEPLSGHPECTSADDCIGTLESRLVRHLHKGKAGDVYCEPCWDSFCQRNPNLQGQFLDEED